MFAISLTEACPAGFCLAGPWAKPEAGSAEESRKTRGALPELASVRWRGRVSRSKLGLDDPDLVQAVRAGDGAAVSEVLELCLPWLRRVVMSRFRFSPEDCDDILQEVQISFFAAAPRFRGECSLRTYLTQIACHKCTDLLRARRREAAALAADPDGADPPGPDRAMDRVTDRLAMEEVLAQLSPRERTVVDLFYRQGKSYKEISARMEMPIGTVGAVKAGALMKLRESLV